MAFKMKGFPMRSAFTKKSGFKHTEGLHEDHHAGEEATGLRRDRGERTIEEIKQSIANVQDNIDEGVYDNDPNAKAYWENHVAQNQKKLAELLRQGKAGGQKRSTTIKF